MQKFFQIKLDVIILAGGKGKRMISSTPKVLHTVAGQMLLEYILKLVEEMRNLRFVTIDEKDCNIMVQNSIIVTNEELQEHDKFLKLKNKYNFETVLQSKSLGTGDAVLIAMEYIQNKDKIDLVNIGSLGVNNNDKRAVLILYGDSPFITLDTVEKLIKTKFEKTVYDDDILPKIDGLSVVCTGFHSSSVRNGYGRFLISDIDERVISIVESAIYEQIGYSVCDTRATLSNICNAGTLIADYDTVIDFIDAKKQNTISYLTAEKDHCEFYLTDIIHHSVKKNKVCAYITITKEEAVGINNTEQKAQAERIIQDQLRAKMQKNGVILISPETVFFSADTKISEGTVVYPFVFFDNQVVIGKNCHILSFSHLDGVTIGDNVKIGPFARIRPETQINDGCRIGNFVEIKNSLIKKNVKNGHMSYIGDAILGEYVNVGAGTVFCNFDGERKYSSEIGAYTFLGSNSSIISPVTTGEYSFIGAGSVITKDVPKNALAISRTRQINIMEWTKVNKTRKNDKL